VERVQLGLACALQHPELPALERAQAGRCLARLGDTRREIMTLECLAFCFVPAGPFQMGDSAGVYDVPYSYWIAHYPLTNAHYQEFVAADGYAQGQYWPEAAKAGFWQPSGFKGRYDSRARREPRKLEEPFALPNHPLVGVSWYEAIAFTRWMTDQLQQRGVLPPTWSMCLPNEPEWEKAARGGLQIPSRPVICSLQEIADIAGAHGSIANPANLPSTRQGGDITLVKNPLPARLFAWGDEANAEYANYERTEIRSTSVVGCFPQSASPYGAEEMNGNVWEWTRSLFHPEGYPGDASAIAQRENIAAHAEAQRVVRGGAFYYYEYFMRCAERFRCSPDEVGKLYGLRLVIIPAIR
jgi:formylglycine-generating enzyme required for sulfatase activity